MTRKAEKRAKSRNNTHKSPPYKPATRVSYCPACTGANPGTPQHDPHVGTGGRRGRAKCTKCGLIWTVVGSSFK